MEFDLNQVRELLAILNQTDVEELCLKSNDFELTIRKGTMAIAPPQPQLGASPSLMVEPNPVAQVVSAPAPAIDKNWVEVTSPMVGTFYRAPAPDEPSFAEVGDTIRRGQTICIIEAMKLMNELEAEINGEVMEILVENGKPIEFGQTLMRVKPTS